jgi:hypothetical protein
MLDPDQMNTDPKHWYTVRYHPDPIENSQQQTQIRIQGTGSATLELKI